jgi:hypothetical protein
MNNMELEIVSEFIYLGTMFQRTESFKKNKINLAEKASKAMYDILQWYPLEIEIHPYSYVQSRLHSNLKSPRLHSNLESARLHSTF